MNGELTLNGYDFKRGIKVKPSIYLIGALKNPEIMKIDQKLRELGFDSFAEWHSVGPDADVHWREHEIARNRSFSQALKGYHAQHVFAFDKLHLDRCDVAVLVLPAGKSGHLELGYAAGKGKQTFIVLDDDPSRFDIMYNFATDVFENKAQLYERLEHEHSNRS